MSTSLHLFLQISQAFFSYAVLLLSSHVLFWKDPSVYDLLIQANFLSLLSGIVIIVFYIKFALSSPLKATHPYAIFYIEFAIALLYMAGFIALVFSPKLRLCQGAICVVVRIDAVFAALNYVVWTASTVLSGYNISKNFKWKFQRVEAISEKTIES